MISSPSLDLCMAYFRTQSHHTAVLHLLHQSLGRSDSGLSVECSRFPDQKNVHSNLYPHDISVFIIYWKVVCKMSNLRNSTYLLHTSFHFGAEVRSIIRSPVSHSTQQDTACFTRACLQLGCVHSRQLNPALISGNGGLV